MSEENVHIVRRLYEAVARHDAETVLGLYDPEVEWDFSRSPFVSVFDQDVYRGHRGIREFARERYELWQDVVDELHELIDAGQHVICVVTTRGRGRASGAPAGRTHAAVWTLRDGKVVRVAWMGSREEALEAAGLATG